MKKEELIKTLYEYDRIAIGRKMLDKRSGFYLLIDFIEGDLNPSWYMAYRHKAIEAAEGLKDQEIRAEVMKYVQPF